MSGPILQRINVIVFCAKPFMLQFPSADVVTWQQWCWALQKMLHSSLPEPDLNPLILQLVVSQVSIPSTSSHSQVFFKILYLLTVFQLRTPLKATDPPSYCPTVQQYLGGIFMSSCQSWKEGSGYTQYPLIAPYSSVARWYIHVSLCKRKVSILITHSCHISPFFNLTQHGLRIRWLQKLEYLLTASKLL